MGISINKIIEFEDINQEGSQKVEQRIFTKTQYELLTDIVENINKPTELLDKIWYSQVQLFSSEQIRSTVKLNDTEYEYINFVIACVERQICTRTFDIASKNKHISRFAKSIIDMVGHTHVYQLLVNLMPLAVQLKDEDLNFLLSETQKTDIFLRSFLECCRHVPKRNRFYQKFPTDQSNSSWWEIFCGCVG